MDETVRAIETFRSWVADTPPGGLVIIAGRLPRRSTLSCHTVPRRAASC